MKSERGVFFAPVASSYFRGWYARFYYGDQNIVLGSVKNPFLLPKRKYASFLDSIKFGLTDELKYGDFEIKMQTKTIIFFNTDIRVGLSVGRSVAEMALEDFCRKMLDWNHLTDIAI